MTTMKRARAKKTSSVGSRKQRGLAMSLKYTITTIVIACAVILGVLTAMGPKLSLQTPPIEKRAMEKIDKLHLLQAGETLEAYKATSYYTYNSGVVITNKRLIAFNNDKNLSIPLDKISMVIVKDTELGHQEVMVSAEANGVIALELYHTDAQKFLNMLHVSDSLIKHYTKHDVKDAMHAAPMPAH